MKPSHDKRWNKAWYFFMFVAAGLIFSWGQVGTRYKSAEKIDTREYLLLRTEADCDLVKSPCAAYAPEYALVVKLDLNQGWQTLRVRAAGQALNESSRIKLSLEPESSLYDSELLPIRFQSPDTWYSDFQLPDQTKSVWKLRVAVEPDERKVWVAEYPLPFL